MLCFKDPTVIIPNENSNEFERLIPDARKETAYRRPAENSGSQWAQDTIWIKNKAIISKVNDKHWKEKEEYKRFQSFATNSHSARKSQEFIVVEVR